MTPQERLQYFQNKVNSLPKHDLFNDIVQQNGVWNKVTTSILSCGITDTSKLDQVAEQIVNAINWECRTIYNLDTNSNKLTIWGYEDEYGNSVKNPAFKQPFSNLPGTFPLFNFLN